MIPSMTLEAPPLPATSGGGGYSCFTGNTAWSRIDNAAAIQKKKKNETGFY